MTKFIQCIQSANQKVSTEETIHAIKKAGFDGAFVQWYNLDNLDIEQEDQLKLTKELGLFVPYVHLSTKNINNLWSKDNSGDILANNFINDLNKIAKYGIELVTMHLSAKPTPLSPNKFGLERLKRIINHAEKLNIKITFENTRTLKFIKYVFNNIKSSNIGVCYDAGHDHAFCNDSFDWDYFKDKIWLVHFSDNDQSDDLHLLPFDGNINWETVLKNLKKAGYKGPVVLESCYRYGYLNTPLNDFYKESYKRAKKLKI